MGARVKATRTVEEGEAHSLLANAILVHLVGTQDSCAAYLPPLQPSLPSFLVMFSKTQNISSVQRRAVKKLSSPWRQMLYAIAFSSLFRTAIAIKTCLSFSVKLSGMHRNVTGRRPAKMRKTDESNNQSDESNQSEEVAASSSSSQEECVICMYAFNRRRTKCYPFGCGNGVRHAICTECNSRMFSVHDDACPICRAPRTDARFMGYRPPRPVDDTNSSMFQSMFQGGTGSIVNVATPNGAVFFSVDSGVPEDHEGPRFFVVQRTLRHAASADSADSQQSNATTANTTANTLVNEILGDPVVQAAIDGLRNPQRGGVAGFLRGIRNASSRRRRAGTQQ